VFDVLLSRYHEYMTSIVLLYLVIGSVDILLIFKSYCYSKNIVKWSESFVTKLTLKSPAKIIGSSSKLSPKIFEPLQLYINNRWCTNFMITVTFWFDEIYTTTIRIPFSSSILTWEVPISTIVAWKLYVKLHFVL